MIRASVKYLPNVGLLLRRSSSTFRPSSSSSVKRDMQRTIPRPRRRTMARRLRWSITRTKLEAKVFNYLLASILVSMANLTCWNLLFQCFQFKFVNFVNRIANHQFVGSYLFMIDKVSCILYVLK